MKVAYQVAACVVLTILQTSALANPELAAKLQKSVVKVAVLAGTTWEDSGSGVIIGPNTIATNFHVVCEFSTFECFSGIRVELDGKPPEPAKIVYVDIERDLAQLEIEKPIGPAVSLRKFESVAAGERVFALGYPKGTKGGKPLWTEGVVSGPVRLSPDSPLYFGPFLRLPKLVIQHSAQIGRGSSGGGLFDRHGRLLGLNTLWIAQGDTQNLNNAVSSDHFGDLPESHRLSVDFFRALPKAPKILPGQDVLKQLTALAERAAQEKPDDWTIWVLLAECYYRALRFDDSIQAARRAVEVNPKTGDGWYWLGSATFMSGNADAACYSFDQAVQVAPAHVDALQSLASCRYSEGRVDEAARLLKIALGLDKENVTGWYSLGLIYANGDQWEPALKCFQYAREIYLKRGESPTPDLLKALAIARLRRGDEDGARELAFELDQVDREYAEQVRDEVAMFRVARAEQLAPPPRQPPPEQPRISKWQSWRDSKNVAHACATLGPIGCFFFGPVGIILAPTVCCVANIGVWAYYSSNEPAVDE